jgi:enterochelin esterase-like enzyme
MTNKNINSSPVTRSLNRRSAMQVSAWTFFGMAAYAGTAGAQSLSSAGRGDWVTPAVTAPGVAHRSFFSPAVASQVSFHVYLPPDYLAAADARFPVLYWLHGSGGGQRGIPVVSGMFDRAIRQGKIAPMIVVFPNGLPDGMWVDSTDGVAPVETMLVRNLVPHIDTSYRTIPSREARILEGFSMGGYGAARIGFAHTGIFASVSMLAGGPLDTDLQGPQVAGNSTFRQRLLETVYGNDIANYRAQSPWFVAAENAEIIRNRKLLLRQVVGTTDFTVKANRTFHQHLAELKIEHEYHELDDVPHDVVKIFAALGENNWDFYRTAFSELLSRTR